MYAYGILCAFVRALGFRANLWGTTTTTTTTTTTAMVVVFVVVVVVAIVPHNTGWVGSRIGEFILSFIHAEVVPVGGLGSALKALYLSKQRIPHIAAFTMNAPLRWVGHCEPTK